MRKRLLLPLGMIAISVLWMLSGLISKNPHSETEALPIPTHHSARAKVLVEVARNQPTARTLTLYGEVRPIRRVAVRAETSGKVTESFVTRGSYVDAGTVLLTLDKEARELRLHEAPPRH